MRFWYKQPFALASVAFLLAGTSISRAQGNTVASRAAYTRVSFEDSAQDGTPDFLRLEAETDRAAFRQWFTFLAEVQYFSAPKNRPPEIVDCASLLRYCYREALMWHDGKWAVEAQLPLVPAFASVRKYSYPRTPLGANLFRVRDGSFIQADLRNGAFAQFADAETLERLNCYLVSRNLQRAKPGDLLFFRRRLEHKDSFHSMVFLGRSQIRPSAAQYVVYDTGRDGEKAGQIRILSMDNLLSFPDPEWRPATANPQFLGVFRWNILRDRP